MAGVRQQFEDLRENLDEFVQQTEYPVLVARCAPDEIAYVMKFLQGLEEVHPQNFFMIFGQPFEDAAAYLDLVADAVRVQIEAAQLARAERGEAPFPSVPPELASRQLAPEVRLHRLLRYLLTLLPNDKDHAFVVGFLPLQCGEPDGYAKLMQSILPVPRIEPWMAGLRIVVHDDRTALRLVPILQQQKQLDTVITFEVDFSTPAVTDSLTKEAADTSLPLDQRMLGLFQLAALDFSYKRHDDALTKYGMLYEFYSKPAVPHMQALCLCGSADVLRAKGDPAQAKSLLQRGIAIAMAGDARAPLLNLLISVVEVCFDLGQHEEAASYADSGGTLAAVSFNPYTYADLIERKGDAELAQGKLALALESYERSEKLCRMYEHFPRWKSVLDKQAKLYDDAGKLGEADAARAERRRVDELEQRGGSGKKPSELMQRPGAHAQP
jgi:tetratricopeptide (TPR) repeat protein